MATEVYKHFFAKWTEAWYELTPEEQRVLLDKVNAARAKFDGQVIVFCQSAWCSEEWLVWGVEKFPNIEALQGYAEALNEFDWLRYVDSKTILGAATQ